MTSRGDLSAFIDPVPKDRSGEKQSGMFLGLEAELVEGVPPSRAPNLLQK